jgi:hypothetical protein
MITTDKIISAFRNGFAKTNRYEVFMPGVSDSETLNVMCDSVTWPGRQISTTEVYTDMKASKRAYSFIPDDVTISFMVSNDWSAWDYLNDWHKTVIGNIQGENDFVVNFKQDYQRQIIIRHLDETDNIRKEVRLKGAFPTTLSSIDLGNQNENTIMRVTATFSYENWESFKYQ